MLAAAISFSCVANGVCSAIDTVDTQVRTITVTEKYAQDLSVFDSYTITEDEQTPSFTGVTAYADDHSAFFDNVSVEETEDYTVEYDCSFDMDAMQYIFTATLLDANGEAVESETIVTDAIVTESGALDAYIEVDGEAYLMSEYCDENGIDDCAVVKIVIAGVMVIVSFVVVTEIAMRNQAKSNYKYNKKLEENNKGVKKGYYITDQSEKTRSGYKSGNYRFGFTTFDNVGCEVASVYNALIALGKTERLSETIYNFERWAIEISLGWGFLGSDPLEIDRYLKKCDIGYTRYLSYSKFKKAVEGKKTCHIIMSRWNDPVSAGLHTYYVRKQGATSYLSYNWHYRDYAPQSETINELNDGGGFIVGYIIWKK